MRRVRKPLLVIEVVLVGIFAAVTLWQKSTEHDAPTAPNDRTAAAPTSSTTRATATTTTTTKAPSTTTTTTDPFGNARADYLEMATAAHQVHELARLQFQETNGRIRWANFPAYCAAVVGSDVIFARRLAAHWWPPSARAAIGPLVLDVAGVARLEDRCAHTQGRSVTIQPVANQIGAASAKVTADQAAVQAALALPATP